MKTSTIHPVRVKRYADMFAAIGAEPRLRILHLLVSSADGMNVSEIQSELRIPGSTLSHHLDKLKHEDLVKVRRDGTFLWYTANTKTLDQLLKFFSAECQAAAAVA